MNEPQTVAAEPSNTSYLVVYFLIVGLIIAQVIVGVVDLGSGRVYANLLIAGAQTCLLSYFFMHLKGADQLTWLVAGSGLFWMFILFLFLLNDYVTRQMGAY